MAKLRANKAVGDLQGTVGGLVYVHRADGSVVVRRSAERTADFTTFQEQNQSRFGQGQLYVKRLRANPEQYAPYRLAARIQRKRACDLAISDFLLPPLVNDVDLSAYRGKAGNPFAFRPLTSSRSGPCA